MQRLTRTIAAFGALVAAAVEATREIGSAHSAADRRAVLDRFAADTDLHATRTAA